MSNKAYSWRNRLIAASAIGILTVPAIPRIYDFTTSHLTDLYHLIVPKQQIMGIKKPDAGNLEDITDKQSHLLPSHQYPLNQADQLRPYKPNLQQSASTWS